MPPSVALLIFIVFAIFAERVVHRSAPEASAATWIPFFWIGIAGSRPITTWLDAEGINDPSTLLEGSPTDRLFYQALIALSFLVLIRRRLRAADVLGSNVLLATYFLYLLCGTLWSDYTGIALRRWVKDFGNVLVVLVLVTEVNPAAAARTVMVRAACFLIPGSVLLIKYFPDLARSYDRFSGRVYYSGVALDKNLLGMALTALLGFVLWAYLENRRSAPSRLKTMHQSICLLLIGLGGWLLSLANSATAVACTVTGAALYLLLMSSFARRHFLKIFFLAAVGAVTVVSTGLLDETKALVATSLERDPSLTGRDEIWRIVLSENIHPLFGAGSYTFWMPDRMARMSEGYMVAFNSAHNGFIDIYLDSGLIGAGLMVFIILSGLIRLAPALTREADRWSAQAGVVFLVVCAIYASTEAIFNRLNLLWIGLLLCMFCIVPRRSPEPQAAPQLAGAPS